MNSWKVFVRWLPAIILSSARYQPSIAVLVTSDKYQVNSIIETKITRVLSCCKKNNVAGKILRSLFHCNISSGKCYNSHFSNIDEVQMEFYLNYIFVITVILDIILVLSSMNENFCEWLDGKGLLSLFMRI